MKRLSWLATVCVWLLLAACGGSSQTGARSAPTQPSAAASGATANGSASAPAAWGEVVGAAKKEGALVLYSQAGSGVSEGLADTFMKAYPDIHVEYNGLGGAETVTKLTTERGAGKFLADVIVNGTSTLFDLKDAQALDSLDGYLTGPQTKETDKWSGGGYVFADNEGKYALMLLAGVSFPFIYNSKMVQPAEFKSWKDLNNPKWNGKISMYDPLVPGNGTATAQFWYVTPSLGKDFIKDFFQQQNPVMSRDDRQLSNWAGQGQYPLAVAAQGFEALKLQQQGVPVGFMAADDLQEKSFVTTSFGSLAVMNKPPHPNATRVYLNWLLSKDGMEALTKASGVPNRRTDTSTTSAVPGTVPKPGVQYLELNKESYVRSRPEALNYVKSVMKA